MRRSSTVAVLLPALLGCGDAHRARRRDEPVPTVDTASASSETGSPPSGPGELDPEVASALNEGMERFAAEVVSVDLAPAAHAVDAVGLRAEPPCPDIGRYPQGEGWFNADCETSQSDHFVGVLIVIDTGWEEYAEWAIGDALLDRWGPALDPGWTRGPAPAPSAAEGYNAVFTVTGPQGDWSMSGQYHEIAYSWDGIAIRQLALGGAVRDPTAEAGTWPERGIVPNVVRTDLEGPSGARLLHVSGALDGLDAAWDTVWATDLAVANAAAGDPCELEPEGLLAVRDPAGDWYDVTFDPAVCDGCGEVAIAGEPLGSVCPDLHPFVARVSP